MTSPAAGFSYQKEPLSEQSRCAPQFVHIMWHACMEVISFSHLGHLIRSFNVMWSGSNSIKNSGFARGAEFGNVN